MLMSHRYSATPPRPLSSRFARRISPRKSTGVRKRELFEEKSKPPLAKRKKTAAPFSKSVAKSIQEDVMDQMYSAFRKQTGTLGGGGAGGAIYGELTQKSFQRVVDYLKDNCGFDASSVFIDIGAGLGKPSAHVAVNPGVRLSLGVELIGGRWWQSMCMMKALLDNDNLKPFAEKMFFAHADMCDMDSFEPVTHLYSFNRGFPPEAMRTMAKLFHKSSSTKYFICYDNERRLEGFGFGVELLEKVSVKMAGSGEGHTCFIYKKIEGSAPKRSRKKSSSSDDFAFVEPPSCVDYAPHVAHPESYVNGWNSFLEKGEVYHSWVVDQIGLNRSSRRTRSRSRRSASPA
jgi:hypothetical protein